MTEQQLPEGWQMVKFGDIAKHISKRVEPSETELEVYVGLEHLDPDSLKIKRHGVPSDVAGQKLLVKKGQIIFGKRRAYQRKVAVADWDCICSAHAMVLEANSEHVIPEFLPFFMQSDVFMNRAVAISEGSLSPTIKWKTLANQEFYFPEKKNQELLLKLFLSNESLRVRGQTCYESSLRLQETLVISIFSNGLNKETTTKTKYLYHPETWQVMRLNELVTKVKRGPSLSANESQRGVRYITSGNLIDGELCLNAEIKHLDNIYTAANCELKVDDIILNCVNSMARVGKSAIVCEEHLYEPAIVGFNNYAFEVNNSLVLPKFLYYWMQDPRFTHRIKALVKPAINQVSFASNELKHILVAFPPLQEQKRIVQILDNVFTYTTKLNESQVTNIKLNKAISAAQGF